MEHDPAAVQAIKRPLSVAVEFAKTGGVVESLEGAVHYRAGDVILTGVRGEHWTIQREKFEQSYAPVEPTIAGENGFYVKKPALVWAKHLTENLKVPVGWQDEPLSGVPGDWLLQYGPDDFGIIQNDIFIKTYEILKAKKPR
ncbi:MAG: PGDYG domain-containing protein [Methylococcaceae bacterium]